MLKPRMEGIRKRVGAALDNWSKGRIKAAKEHASRKHSIALTAGRRVALAAAGAPGSILFASSQAESARRSAISAKNRAKRIEERHSTGWIGGLKKRIKGT